MQRLPVDIIIPIYNAYDDLIQCIESIKKYTDLSKDRLILINDCSPDERIAPYLDSLLAENIVVIHNEKNKGFSGNVNIGMDYSTDRDIVLLNSDTCVTKGWLDKINACAYSSPEIGTVTPLSNAATLVSVPVICQDNKIPEGFTIDEYAELVERCSFKAYPRITVAVGFCMYIKRETIIETGHFDAETFERGYGEENDFCHRAEQLGYIHVMCDDTFIYHKGTGSFVGEEKRKLIEAHEQIINERYLMQNRRNSEYLAENPDQYIRDNINFYADFVSNGRKNLLYLLHLDFRADEDNNIGGTQLHVKDLVDNLKNEFNVFVLARSKDKLRLSIYYENERKTLEFFVGKEVTPYFTRQRERIIYENILKAFKINLVHVHHTMQLSLDIFKTARELNIPIHLTLHDYYYVCPSYILYSSELKSTCIGKESKEICRKCLNERAGIAKQVDIMDKWREKCKEALFSCDKIYVPSKSVRDNFEKYYPGISERIQVIYHGTDFKNIAKADKEAVNNNIIIDKTVKLHMDNLEIVNGRVALARGWCFRVDDDCNQANIYVEVVSKSGQRQLLKTARQPRPDVATAMGNYKYKDSGFAIIITNGALLLPPAYFRVIIEIGGKMYTNGKKFKLRGMDSGRLDLNKAAFRIACLGAFTDIKGSRDILEMAQLSKNDNIEWFVIGAVGDIETLTKSPDNIHFTGAYNREDLPEMMKEYKIDLVCVLSIVPESFSYTVSESLILNIPVLVRNIGALGERIESNGCGWIVDADASAKDILQTINNLKNSEEYREIKQKTIEYKEKTVLEMVAEYRQHYIAGFADNTSQQFDRKMIFEAVVQD